MVRRFLSAFGSQLCVGNPCRNIGRVPTNPLAPLQLSKPGRDVIAQLLVTQTLLQSLKSFQNNGVLTLIVSRDTQFLHQLQDFA